MICTFIKFTVRYIKFCLNLFIVKENTSSTAKKQLIYADLGTAPGKQPVAAPAHDKVVYSTVQSSDM